MRGRGVQETYQTLSPFHNQVLGKLMNIITRVLELPPSSRSVEDEVWIQKWVPVA